MKKRKFTKKNTFSTYINFESSTSHLETAVCYPQPMWLVYPIRPNSCHKLRDGTQHADISFFFFVFIICIIFKNTYTWRWMCVCGVNPNYVFFWTPNVKNDLKNPWKNTLKKTTFMFIMFFITWNSRSSNTSRVTSARNLPFK